ncbi:MAG: hypothetical protein AVDCRST_MAG14-2242, partial [uncultured Rubrobacteraceae bacterium]
GLHPPPRNLRPDHRLRGGVSGRGRRRLRDGNATQRRARKPAGERPDPGRTRAGLCGAGRGVASRHERLFTRGLYPPGDEHARPLLPRLLRGANFRPGSLLRALLHQRHRGWAGTAVLRGPEQPGGRGVRGHLRSGGRRLRFRGEARYVLHAGSHHKPAAFYNRDQPGHRRDDPWGEQYRSRRRPRGRPRLRLPDGPNCLLPQEARRHSSHPRCLRSRSPPSGRLVSLRSL